MELKIISPKYGEFTVLYDNEDHEKLSKYKWYVQKIYKRNSLFYVQSKIYKNGRQSNIYMHRLIINCQENKFVDHINHNSLDNRKSNLRVCTQKENRRNSKSNKNSSSKFKGVTWHKRNKKWVSQIRTNKKNIWLGLFENEIDAALVYNGAAKYLFGEFAYLNEVL